MRHLFRIARFQATLLRRNFAVLGTHVVGLASLLLMSVVRIRDEQADAQALMTVLLLGAATGAPLTVGVHTLVGERFRGTLEALLLLPVLKSTLLAGKAATILLIAGVEILAVMLFFATFGYATSNPDVLTALTSAEVLFVLFLGAPQLAVLLTLIVITISGGARDAQSASNLALLMGVPVAVVVLGLWFGALAFGPRLVFIVIVATTFSCAIAARMAATWLTDDRLLSRRG